MTVAEKRPTTSEQIVAALRDGPKCGGYFYANYLPTFAQRISEMNAAGWVIASRLCTDHEHRGTIHTYELVKDLEPQPVQTSWL